MWKPRDFLRNLCLFSFLGLLLFLFLGSLLGPVIAVLVLFFGPVAAAALWEGMRSATVRGTAVPAGHIWTASRAMAEVYLTFTVILSMLVALWTPGFLRWLGTADLFVIIFIYGTMTLVAFVAIRWSYAWGVTLALEKTKGNTG
jgi:hypothetical protein